MTNRRAGRAVIGPKSNTPVAQKAIDLSNPNHYASIIKRVCNRRMPQNEFPDLCAHALGCDPRRGGPATLRLLLRHVLSFSAGPALGDADSRSYLFGEHFLEHQWHLSQFHSQSVFPVAAAQSVVQHPGINHRQLQPNLLRMAFTCSITREMPTGRTSMVRQLIGFRFTIPIEH